MTHLRHFLTLMIWMALVTSPIEASDALSDIHGRLSKNSLICADFSQEKQLQVLKRPLVSNGRLVFVAGKGVLWQVREPFATQVLVKRDALIKWNDNGVPQRLNLERAPVFRALSQVFLTVFTGNMSGLQDSFEIVPHVSGARWRLSLVPRDPGFARIIARVHVAGDSFVDELTIVEGRGDQTLIRFSHINTESCQLDAAEKEYFAH